MTLPSPTPGVNTIPGVFLCHRKDSLNFCTEPLTVLNRFWTILQYAVTS
jgi:hypothetical protein